MFKSLLDLSEVYEALKHHQKTYCELIHTIRQLGERAADVKKINQKVTYNLLELVKMLDDPTNKYYLKINQAEEIKDDDPLSNRYINKVRKRMKKAYFESSKQSFIF